MFEAKKEELNQMTGILRETKGIGTVKEKLELLKLYLKSNNKSNVYSLVADTSQNNLILEEQIKLIEKINYLKDKESDNTCLLLNDYFPRGNIESANKIIDLYLNSCNEKRMYELLSNPCIMLFRTNDEIIELSTLYENIMRTEKYLSYIRCTETYERVSYQVYEMLTDLDKITEEDFTFETQKQLIYDYLKSVDFNIINFKGKAKTRC